MRIFHGKSGPARWTSAFSVVSHLTMAHVSERLRLMAFLEIMKYSNLNNSDRTDNFGSRLGLHCRALLSTSRC